MESIPSVPDDDLYSVQDVSHEPVTPSIDSIIEQAEQSDIAVSHIGVFEAGSIRVDAGDVGLMSTEALNGCHVTIVNARQADGSYDMSMTHFPPELGAARYDRELQGLADRFREQAAEPQAVVTVYATDRFPAEIAAVTRLFPTAEQHALSYTARDAERRMQPDAGRCLAVMDARAGAPAQLHVLTDSGDLVVPMKSNP